MKNIKTFEQYSSNFNLEDAMNKIKEEFSEEKVAEMFDEEILEWLDSDWEEDGYDSEYEWYVDHNNNEAQDVVYKQIIDWYKKKYNVELSDNEYVDLFDEISDYYAI